MAAEMGREYVGPIPDWHLLFQAAELHRMSTQELREHPNFVWLMETAFAELEFRGQMQEKANKRKR